MPRPMPATSRSWLSASRAGARNELPPSSPLEVADALPQPEEAQLGAGLGRHPGREASRPGAERECLARRVARSARGKGHLPVEVQPVWCRRQRQGRRPEAAEMPARLLSGELAEVQVQRREVIRRNAAHRRAECRQVRQRCNGVSVRVQRLAQPDGGVGHHEQVVEQDVADALARHHLVTPIGLRRIGHAVPGHQARHGDPGDGRILDRRQHEEPRRRASLIGSGGGQRDLATKPRTEVGVVVDRDLTQQALRHLVDLLLARGVVSKAVQVPDQVEQVELLAARRLEVDLEVQSRIGRHGAGSPVAGRGEEEQVAGDDRHADHRQQRGERNDEAAHSISRPGCRAARCRPAAAARYRAGASGAASHRTASGRGSRRPGSSHFRSRCGVADWP